MDKIRLGIKNKFPLIDFAKYGTLGRKKMHPDLLIGNYPTEAPLFKEGDILDANAVYDLILCNNDALGVVRMTDRLRKAEQGLEDTNELVDENRQAIEEVRQSVGENNQNIEENRSNIEELQSNVNTISDNVAENTQRYNELLSRLNGVYTKEQVDTALQILRELMNTDPYKHRFMTQEQYDALTEYERNTVYFIWDGEPEEESGEPTFPATFPITFGSRDSFPYEFPIELT